MTLQHYKDQAVNAVWGNNLFGLTQDPYTQNAELLIVKAGNAHSPTWL